LKNALLLLVLLASFPAFADDRDGKLEIAPLSNNVYLHTSYRQLPGVGWFPSNGLVVVDGKRAVLVDTAWTVEATQGIVEWLRARALDLDYVIVTHSHSDRTAGLAYLHSIGIETFASGKTNDLLEMRKETRARNDFPEGGKNDTLIEIAWPGPGHAPDNHVVWIPGDGVLFAGCLAKSVASESLGNVADADIPAWNASMAKVLARFAAADIVVPGHGSPGGLELLRHTQALVEAHERARTE